MDFIETIFSFIPLLMIIIFVVRLVAAAKKKNTSKHPNPVKPAEHQIPPAEKEWKEQNQGNMIQSRLESLLQDKFPRLVPPSASAGGPVRDNKGSAAVKPVQRFRPSASQSLNTLSNSKKNNPDAPPVPKELNARIRVNNLPELKRAAIWSEILGKPKGLD